MTRAELIERLEAAPEGSRELDAEIAVIDTPWLLECVPDEAQGPGHWIIPEGHRMNFGQSGSMPTYAPDYTTSMDAAHGLVRKGWYTIHAGQNPRSYQWYWCIGCCADHPDAEPRENGGWVARNYEARAATPALALCIAALKSLGEE